MVFKKPYAFLIKYFKILHLILSGLTLYLSFKILKLVRFFNDYASSGYYNSNSNIAGSYINFFMYLAVIIILSLAIFIYMLMRNKKKNTKFYVALIAYYIFVFILLTVSFGILQSLENEIVDIQMARVYRDLSLIFSLPQYFFIIYAFLRGCGFNLKQFNFQLDLKEMEIEATDNEEIELTVGVETYKAQRIIHRFLREFKYYILENTFIFICIVSIIGIIIGTGIFLNVNVYNKVYKENKVFNYKTFNIKVNNSYMTNKDFKGNVLVEGKYYLILNLNVVNKSSASNKLRLTDFRLKVNNKNIYPTKNKMEYFVDLGNPYKEDKIAPNSDNNFILIYELEENYIRKNYLIKVLDSVNYKVGDISSSYKDVKVKPKRIDNSSIIGNYQQQDKISLKDSILGDSTIKITSYNITNTYKYNYQFCIEDDCKESTDIVTPDYSSASNSTLLVLDYNLKLDKKTSYYENMKSDKKIFSQFFKVRYNLNGESITVNTKNRTPNELKDKVVLQVDSNIKKASKVDLVIGIRNKEYLVSIK